MMGFALTLRIGLTIALGAIPGWRCSSDASCQLNGVCSANGGCTCDPQWSGANCSVLNLGLSTEAYTGMAPNTSTWGGHPVQDPETKRWDLYVAEMTNHCELNAWTTNSIIVHASAAAVTGPYEFESVVQPAWSHNPLATLDPASGQTLIAHIGCGTIAAGHAPRNCTARAGLGAGDSPATAAAARAARAGKPPCECSTKGEACQTLQVLSRRSTRPGAPWGDVTVAWPLVNTSAWPSCISNPTLLLGRTGTGPVLLGFNGNLAPPNNHGPTSHPGLLVSRSGHWAGPYDYVNRSEGGGEASVHYLTDSGFAEDSVLYRDRRGMVHMLLHGFCKELGIRTCRVFFFFFCSSVHPQLELALGDPPASLPRCLQTYSAHHPPVAPGAHRLAHAVPAVALAPRR